MDSGGRGLVWRSARRSACALAYVSAALALALPAAAQVVVVVSVPEDREVAAQLRQLTDLQVDEQTPPAPQASLGAIMAQTGQGAAAYAVVVDRPGDAAHVLRLADKSVASRVLAPELIAEAPYAVALTIAELLEWLGAVPPARPLTPSTEASITAEPAAGETYEMPATSAAGLAVALGADLEITASPGFDLTLLRPALGVSLQWGRGQRSPWFALGVRLAAPASARRELETATSSVTALEYSSIDPAVSAALGLGSWSAALLAQLEFGLSVVHVEAGDERDRVLTDSDSVTPWFGLGLFLRYPLFAGLSLAAGAGGQWLVEPGRYRVEDVRVLEEGRLRLATRLGLVWESGR